MDDLPSTQVESTNSDDESGGGVLATVIDAVRTYLGDVPAAIKKNVAKAFGHLMKIPNAYIDGRAAEVRAESDARVALTKATAKKLAASIEIDQSLGAIAAATHASKILRQQVNAAQVIGKAVEEIKKQPPPPDQEEATEISDDWLNAFEREAIDMSSEHMQRLFGKILAGEIRRPKSYSIRTVKLMAQLDNRPAELFRRLCSLACSLRIAGHDVYDSRVIALGKAATANGLQEFGLSFGDLNTLFEYGLIINDYNSYMMYVGSIVNEQGSVGMPIEYGGGLWALRSKTPMTVQQRIEVKMHGVALSRAGRELIDIVDIEPDDAYTKALFAYFDTQGFTVSPVKVG